MKWKLSSKLPAKELNYLLMTSSAFRDKALSFGARAVLFVVADHHLRGGAPYDYLKSISKSARELNAIGKELVNAGYIEVVQ